MSSSTTALAKSEGEVDYVGHRCEKARAETLEQSATTINTTDVGIRTTAVAGALAIGRELAKVQKLLASKGRKSLFGPWLKKRCDLSKSAVYKDIAAHETFGNCPQVVDTFALQALHLLSADDCPEEAVKAAIKLAKKGKPVTHEVAKQLKEEYGGKEEDAQDAATADDHEDDEATQGAADGQEEGTQDDDERDDAEEDQDGDDARDPGDADEEDGDDEDEEDAQDDHDDADEDEDEEPDADDEDDEGDPADEDEDENEEDDEDRDADEDDEDGDDEQDEDQDDEEDEPATAVWLAKSSEKLATACHNRRLVARFLSGIVRMLNDVGQGKTMARLKKEITKLKGT